MRDLGIEFISVFGLPPADFVHLAAAFEYVARPELRLALDTMHWVRAGLGANELRQIGPDQIGYVQLSDTTLKLRLKSYMQEAMYERIAPGDGELPLAELLNAAPEDVVIGLEIPMRSLAEAGVSPIDRLRSCVAAARQLGCG